MRILQFGLSFLVLGLLAVLITCGGDSNPRSHDPSPQSPTYTGVFMHHNDLGGTGRNTNEAVLTVANVNQSQFGKLFSYQLDGAVYAQPLYVSNVPIAGGIHNVVYVATEHDTVYAFDADGAAGAPFWSINFTKPSAGITSAPSSGLPGGGAIAPEVGITSTPVIDGKVGSLYVVTETRENGKFVHKLHALDITNGNERANSPVAIQASVAGTGIGSSGGQITFQSLYELQRCALLLVNGTVYVAFASHHDLGPYHGWVLGYDAASLKQVVIWNDTPDGQGGGIWLSGAALSADSAGNIFVVVGNGTFDADKGGRNYGDTILKLKPNGNSLTMIDYFTPFDQQMLANKDMDLGSSGFTLLPDQPGPVTHLGIAAGKSGKIYLLDRDDMGKFQSGSDSQIVQSIPSALGSGANDNDYSTATYWQSNVYFIGNGDVIKQFQIMNGQLSSAPVARGSRPYVYPGGNMSISANGSSNGIIWAIEAGTVNTLHAYDATDVSKELYNSNQAGSRDQFGAAGKFTVPTVINGKVYVAGKTELAAFGLL